MGRSSLTLAHELSTEGDGARLLHAEASVTVVWINKHTGRPVPLPDCIRQLAGD
jgi:acyl-CoA thioester hydrolase